MGCRQSSTKGNASTGAGRGGDTRSVRPGKSDASASAVATGAPRPAPPPDASPQDPADVILESLFNCYKTSLTHELGPLALAQMMQDTCRFGGVPEKSFPSTEDATAIVKAMDSNENGTVDISEFKAWIKGGLAKTPSDLSMMAKRTKQGHRLVTFLQLVAKEIDTNSQMQEFNEGDLEIVDVDPADEIRVAEATAIDEYESMKPKAMNRTPSDISARFSDLLEDADIHVPENYLVMIGDLFYLFDVDGDDALDVRELYSLCAHVKRTCRIRAFWAKHLAELGPQDAGKILRHLDADGNGSVDLKELTTWLVDGFQRSIAELREIMDQGPQASRFVALLIAFRKWLHDAYLRRDSLEVALQRLFRTYSNCSYGSMDSEGIFRMTRFLIDEVKRQTAGKNAQIETDATFTIADAQFVVDALDMDGNGTIEMDEFSAWVRAGLARTESQLRSLETRKPRITSFIRVIRAYLATSGATAVFIARDAFEAELHAMFSQFDPEGNGSLDDSQMLNMMLSSRVPSDSEDFSPTRDDATFIIQMMDVDGDMRIDVAEFVSWVQAGIRKSNRDLSALVKKSARHKNLVKFLRRIKARFADFAMRDELRSEINSTSKPSLKMDAQARISFIFDKHDFSGSGHADANSILAVSKKSSSNPVSRLLRDPGTEKHSPFLNKLTRLHSIMTLCATLLTLLLATWRWASLFSAVRADAM